jgi:hypothetical protein
MEYSTIDSKVLLQFLMYVGILDLDGISCCRVSRVASDLTLDFTFILSYFISPIHPPRLADS